MTLARLKQTRLSRRVVGIARVGGCVRERARFVARELAERGAGAYTLRDGGRRVVVRHGTEDAWVVGEVFAERLYAFPEPVERELSQAPSVLDLGAHIGTFALWAHTRRPAARVHSVEADPANAAVLRRAVAANQGAWTMEEAAAAPAAGTVRFAASGGSGSHVVGRGGVEVAAVDVVERAVGADLVKVDVEGAEWPILADERLRSCRARAWVLEVHPAGAPDPDFEGAAHARLRELGYTTAAIPGAPAGAAMLWAWRA